LWVAAVLWAAPSGAQDAAQDVTGEWQGLLPAPTAPERLQHMVLRVAREGDGRLSAALFNLETGGFGAPISALSASVERGVLRLTFRGNEYEGVVAPSGRAIAGTFTGPRVPTRTFDLARPDARTAWRDASTHRTRFVSVEPGVRLEVLEWGGTGRPLVLLSGLGNNAHVFDQLAPKLTDRYRVYAITRRGFAPSSMPTSGYLADSLADDVLAVLDSLRLERPVLVGHSIAGQELSSIGSRRPERVAGLVYLDAGFVYAFYDPAQQHAWFTIPDVRRRLATVYDDRAPLSFAERAAMVRELADSTLPVLARDLRRWATELDGVPNPAERPAPPRRDLVAEAIDGGAQRYTHIGGPVLAIYAAPPPLPRNAPADSAERARMDSTMLARVQPQIDAFRRGVPQARVVRIPHAEHYVFRSNEADVLRELRAFVDALPR
jgi:pimeloyl-ACP methyl ester carboxylesterase